MREERFKPFAEPVQSRLPVRSYGDPVLGAAAIAHVQHRAGDALVREGVVFRAAEMLLLGRGNHLGEGSVGDVTELMPRLDVVVAAVDITIALHCEAAAAMGGDGACGVLAVHARQGGVDGVDMDSALAITAAPLVVNCDQEPPPGRCRDGAR